MSLFAKTDHYPAPYPNRRPWARERLYFRGDDYFRDLLRSLDRARVTVDFETYIFEAGILGDRIVSALARAVRRKVRVRLLVDGVGSPDFTTHYGPRLEKAGIPFHVYRSWPVFFSALFHKFQLIHLARSLQKAQALFDSGKHRDHRKQCRVDGKEVWIGSFNVSDWHLEKEKGKGTWRDTGMRLSGVKSLVFQLAFHIAWEDSWPRHLGRLYRRILVQWLSHDIQGSPIRMTINRRLRQAFRRELLERVRSARRRIWILTPYFVPTGPLLRAITDAARRGCDVRLILPGLSDVPMVRWASMTFFRKILRAGCRLFEYQKSVLHAKTTLVDSWVLVGSSNLDYRSLRKDLEINIIPREKKSIRALERQFQQDELQSREVTLTDLKRYPFWTRILSWFFFRFRYWF